MGNLTDADNPQHAGTPGVAKANESSVSSLDLGNIAASMGAKFCDVLYLSMAPLNMAVASSAPNAQNLKLFLCGWPYRRMRCEKQMQVLAPQDESESRVQRIEQGFRPALALSQETGKNSQTHRAPTLRPKLCPHCPPVPTVSSAFYPLCAVGCTRAGSRKRAARCKQDRKGGCWRLEVL